MPLTPKALQDLFDELEASRASYKRAWENLQEIRWALKDTAGVELPPPARKCIDIEDRILKDGVRKTVKDHQTALDGLVKAIREFRKFTDQPLTLRGSGYAHAVQELNKAIDRGGGASAMMRNGMPPFEFDVINYWSEVKLDIIKDYARAYSTIMAKQQWCKGHFYIDAYAGAGMHISRATGEFIPGSPLNAVNTIPAFSHYYLIDLDSGKTDNLRQLTKEFQNVTVFDGDCNNVLMTDVFPSLLAEKFCRSLCVLDPYGLHLNWNVVKAAGQSRTIEIFLNFPVADINRNALWNQPNQVKPEQAARLTAFWGDESWRAVAYDTSMDFFGHPTKTDNETIVEAFRKRLADVAGFKYVLEPMPMRNRNNAVVYYLIFATPNATADKIVKHIFNKYKDRQG